MSCENAEFIDQSPIFSVDELSSMRFSDTISKVRAGRWLGKFLVEFHPAFFSGFGDPVASHCVLPCEQWLQDTRENPSSLIIVEGWYYPRLGGNYPAT